MTESFHYSFPRYLSAKKSVDDRALNRQVWQTLVQGLEQARLFQTRPSHALEVLEIGAGTGSMVERMLAWGGLQQANYTALDASAENIAAAAYHLSQWAAEQGYTWQEIPENGLHLARPGQQLHLHLETSDLFEYIEHQQGRCWDLLIAHAFLDLLDIPSALPQVFRLLNPGSWFYFSINFDGATLLEPAIDPPFDDLIERLYHQTMDDRLTNGKPSGDSRSGRHLFTHLKNSGASILAAGASDWVVFAGPDGRYPEDEAYFLHFIIHTIHQALQGQPQLDLERFRRWVAQRHAQIERGELVYIAHQLDFTGRTGPAQENKKEA